MTDEDFDPTAAFDMEQDALQKQLLMAQALRRQPKAVGMQGGFGKALRSIAGHVGEWKAQAGLQDLAEQRRTTVSPQHRLELSLKKANLGKIQTQEAFDNAPASQLFHDLAKKFGFALPQGVTNAQAKEMLGMAERAYAADQRAQELRLNRSAMAGARADAAGVRAQEKTDKDVKELAEDLGKSGAPGFYQQAATAQTIADDNPDDLPGFGPIAGLLPDWAPGISKDAIQLRQSIGQMLAEYRKGVTGAGMSDAERSEYGQITGLLKSGNEESVRLGMQQLRKAMDARTSARTSGSTPEAAAEYSRREPWVGEAVGRARGGTPKATQPKAPAGRQEVRDRSGKLLGYINADGTEEMAP